MDISRLLGKSLRLNELGKAEGLSSGKLNAWNLPEFEPMRQNMLSERDLGMDNYLTKLTRSGAEGPAAALGLEKYNQGFSNSLLELINKMRGGYIDKGLTLGHQASDDAFRQQQADRALAMQWQGQHDARMAQPNDFMKTMQGIGAVTGAIGNIADLGFGGAGLMGMLPGQNGTSSMAGGAQSSIINQLIQQLMLKLGTGGLGG